MNAKAKEAVMAAFARGELDVLVSTTVIEVGVDVPNANLMIVENAERFGLSQLHQLRGRVGRGDVKSYCVLVSDTRNPDTAQRLKVLCESNDGFRISEEDLKLRGPGDFFGARQHGLPQLKVADLAGDLRLLQEAQQAAEELLDRDPTLTQPEHSRIAWQVRRLFSRQENHLN
jgi:ATP-dependent DNA helicase RecG